MQISDVRKEAAKSGPFSRQMIAFRGAAPAALELCLHVHPALPGWTNSFRATALGPALKCCLCEELMAKG